MPAFFRPVSRKFYWTRSYQDTSYAMIAFEERARTSSALQTKDNHHVCA